MFVKLYLALELNKWGCMHDSHKHHLQDNQEGVLNWPIDAKSKNRQSYLIKSEVKTIVIWQSQSRSGALLHPASWCCGCRFVLSARGLLLIPLFFCMYRWLQERVYGKEPTQICKVKNSCLDSQRGAVFYLYVKLGTKLGDLVLLNTSVWPLSCMTSPIFILQMLRGLSYSSWPWTLSTVQTGLGPVILLPGAGISVLCPVQRVFYAGF